MSKTELGVVIARLEETIEALNIALSPMPTSLDSPSNLSWEEIEKTRALAEELLQNITGRQSWECFRFGKRAVAQYRKLTEDNDA